MSHFPVKQHFFNYLFPSVFMGIFGFFVVVPITTFYLNPKDFGIFALLSAFTLPIGPLSSAGVTWVLAGNFFKVSDDERRSLLFNILAVDLGLKIFWVSFFWLMSPLMLPKVIPEFQQEFFWYFRLSLVSTILTTFAPTVSYHLVLRKRSQIHAAFEIIPWLAGTLCMLFAVSFLQWKTEALFFGPLVSGLISSLLSLGYLKSHLVFQLNRRWLKEIFQVGLPTIPASFVEMLRNLLDRYFIQYWSNLTSLGYYSHSQVYRSLFTMGTKAFSRAFSPLALETFSNDAPPKNLEMRLNQWYFLIGAAGIIVSFFADEAIDVLTHSKFTAASVMVKTWFVLILSFSYAIPYNNYLLARKENAFMMRSDIAFNIIFLCLTIPGVYYGGAIGAAIVAVSGNFSLQIGRHYYAHKQGCPTLNNSMLVYSTMLVVLPIFLISYMQPALIIKFLGAGIFLLLLWGGFRITTMAVTKPCSQTIKEP